MTNNEMVNMPKDAVDVLEAACTISEAVDKARATPSGYMTNLKFFSWCDFVLSGTTPLHFTVPTDQEVILTAITCKPGGSWTPPTPDGRWIMPDSLGLLTVGTDAEKPGATFDVLALMDGYHRRTAVDRLSRISSLHVLLDYLGECVRAETDERKKLVGVVALDEAIKSARVAWTAYNTSVLAPEGCLYVPMACHGGTCISVERHERTERLFSQCRPSGFVSGWRRRLINWLTPRGLKTQFAHVSAVPADATHNRHDDFDIVGDELTEPVSFTLYGYTKREVSSEIGKAVTERMLSVLTAPENEPAIDDVVEVAL